MAVEAPKAGNPVLALVAEQRTDNERLRNEVFRLRAELRKVRTEAHRAERERDAAAANIMQRSGAPVDATRLARLLEQRSAELDEALAELSACAAQRDNLERRFQATQQELRASQAEVQRQLADRKKTELQISTLEQKIEDLQALRLSEVNSQQRREKRMEQASHAVMVAQHELRQKDAQITELQRQLKDAEMRELQITSQHPQAVAKLAARAQTEETRSYREQTQRLADQLNNALADLKANVMQLREKDRELLELQALRAEDAKQIAVLDREQKTQLEDLQHYTSVISDLQALLRNREAEIKLREDEIASCTGRLDEAKAEMEQCRARLREREQSLRDLQQSTDVTRAGHQTANAQLQQLEQQLTFARAQITQLQKDHEAQEYHAQQLEEMLTSARNAAELADSRRTAAEEARVAALRAVDEKNGTIAFMKGSIESLEQALQRSVMTLREKDVDLEQKSNIIFELERTCELARTPGVRRDAVMQDIQRDIQQKTQRIRKLEEELENSRQQCARLQATANSHRDDLENLRLRLRTVEAELHGSTAAASLGRDAGEGRAASVLARELRESQADLRRAETENRALKETILTLRATPVIPARRDTLASAYPLLSQSRHTSLSLNDARKEEESRGSSPVDEIEAWDDEVEGLEIDEDAPPSAVRGGVAPRPAPKAQKTQTAAEWEPVAASVRELAAVLHITVSRFASTSQGTASLVNSIHQRIGSLLEALAVKEAALERSADDVKRLEAGTVAQRAQFMADVEQWNKVVNQLISAVREGSVAKSEALLPRLEWLTSRMQNTLPSKVPVSSRSDRGSQQGSRRSSNASSLLRT
eukprot:TRINITY_DN2793_c0_g1_i1.p1 TRINITY_DN2793_c0_g1~~TRINITY_DN2793_c0_g1_i1.p1  ORF type:complete len:843 (+),score=189.14 TRINITY_DN2793_c0_g1_i1:46-2529(+)